jgi:hypothetical protein
MDKDTTERCRPVDIMEISDDPFLRELLTAVWSDIYLVEVEKCENLGFIERHLIAVRHCEQVFNEGGLQKKGPPGSPTIIGDGFDVVDEQKFSLFLLKYAR